MYVRTARLFRGQGGGRRAAQRAGNWHQAPPAEHVRARDAHMRR